MHCLRSRSNNGGLNERTMETLHGNIKWIASLLFRYDMKLNGVVCWPFCAEIVWIEMVPGSFYINTTTLSTITITFCHQSTLAHMVCRPHMCLFLSNHTDRRHPYFENSSVPWPFQNVLSFASTLSHSLFHPDMWIRQYMGAVLLKVLQGGGTCG